MREIALAIQGLSFSYADTPILQDISLSVYQDEFIGLIGPNGSGKSTLLRLILGLLSPSKGVIQVYGQTPVKARPMIGYVPQYPMFSRDFPITTKEVVMLGAYTRHGIQGNDVVQEVMEVVELDHLANQAIATLSGGQLQRLLIARALVIQPRMLILDEPVANIDTRAEANIFSLLHEYNARMSIIVVSHEISFISRYISRVACLNKTLVCHEPVSIDGKIIEDLYDMPVKFVDHKHMI